MRTYQLEDGATLVVSIDGGAWETIAFSKADFGDIGQATAAEVAKVLDGHDLLDASVDDGGDLVIRTATRGSTASLEIDPDRSTAAAPLGLSGGAAATGSGLQLARLIGLARAPFPLPAGAEMNVVVDGRRRKVTFDRGITAGAATADEVVKEINARQKGVARVSRDDRVMLTSSTFGPDGAVEVRPPDDPAKMDAAGILGFVGAASVSRPYAAEPAVLRGTGPWTGLAIANLTAAPIELHLPAGPLWAPAGRTIPIDTAAAAHPALQRLIAQGAVRLMPATEQRPAAGGGRPERPGRRD